jgi:23S rRNA pseudouridine1911/1915/1917 synthase
VKKLPRKRVSGSRPKTPRRRPPRFSRELAILYEDDAVVAVNKPAGLLAVPAPGSDAPSALSLLAADLNPRREQALVVHRIDRFTSGVLLFAKTKADREALVRQFLAHTPVRQYLAVVRGKLDRGKLGGGHLDRGNLARGHREGGNHTGERPAAKEETLVHYFRREGMYQELSNERDRKAARAELKYSVERVLRAASLVRVTLVTGLQNQIRVQFAALGHPVIGDRKYCPDEASERRIARVALHAARLEFVHPRSGETVSIECGPPPDFQSLVKALSPPARGRR